MSTDESEIIARLKFLHNVRPGDKIDTGLVVRQPNDWYTPLSRYIRGETKAKTLAFLRKTLDDAFELYMQYFNSEKDHLVELSKVLITDLQTSLVGIANLKKTYSYDLKFMCDLTTISERTQMRLQSIPSPGIAQTRCRCAGLAACAQRLARPAARSQRAAARRQPAGACSTAT